MIITTGIDYSIRMLLANTAKTNFDLHSKRGWYICDPTGTIYANNSGVWTFGVSPANATDSFWKTRKEAREFIKKMRANP
jgi:hypothetical protein